MSTLSKSLMSGIIILLVVLNPMQKMPKRMKYFNLISLMFSLSASITINEMKLEMASPIWDQLNCNSFKLNHISSILEPYFFISKLIFLYFQYHISLFLESYFFISRIIFLQFRRKNGWKFWTENRPCSNRTKFLGQLWTFQWNSNVLNGKVKAA